MMILQEFSHFYFESSKTNQNDSINSILIFDTWVCVCTEFRMFDSFQNTRLLNKCQMEVNRKDFFFSFINSSSFRRISNVPFFGFNDKQKKTFESRFFRILFTWKTKNKINVDNEKTFVVFVIQCFFSFLFF